MGNQIIIALSHAQIFSGSGHPLLFEVGTKKGYVPENWTGTLWKFLHSCKAQICIPEAWHPSPQRQHDQILMDVINHCLQSPKQSKRINRVRLYLRIIMLTDICNKYGTHIEPWALTGSTTAQTTLSWPAQTAHLTQTGHYGEKPKKVFCC